MTPVSAVDVCTPEEVKSRPGACAPLAVTVTAGGRRSGRERYGPAVVAANVTCEPGETVRLPGEGETCTVGAALAVAGCAHARVPPASRRASPSGTAKRRRSIYTRTPMTNTWCLMSMCSRNGVRVPHVVCSRNLGPQGDGFVLGGDDEGLLDPVDVPGQVRRIGLGVELL